MVTLHVKAIIALLVLASCTWADTIGPWSEWSECFVDGCGSGEQTRSRMLYGLPETRIKECTVPCVEDSEDGNSTDTSSGNTDDDDEEMGELNMDLGEPNNEVQYSACNATCGAGKETWILLCGDGKPCGVKFVDCFTDCNPAYITVTYEQTKDCDAVCTPAHDGKYAEGFKRVRKLCNGVACGEQDEPCSAWCRDRGYGNPNSGSWGPCSVECGLGTRTRPINSTAVETEYCEEAACQDMMIYSLRTEDSSVNEWSECSVECGTGYQAKHCPECGLSKDVRVCEGSQCHESTSAEFIEWSEWSECSAMCGKGTSTRSQLDCEESECSTQKKTCFHSCIGSQALEDQGNSKIYSLRVEGRSSYITSVGESLRITCSSLSSSKITLTWLAISNSEKLFNELSTEYMFVDGNVLSYTIMDIQEVQPQHHGNYMCGIVNGQSIYTQIIDVNVLHFTQSPHPGPKTLSAGESILLTCAVYASDDADQIYLRWLHEERELLSTLHTKFPFTSTLVLSGVSERDAGNYRCEAAYEDIIIQSSTTKINVLTAYPYVVYKREEAGPQEESEWSEWSRCSANCGYGMQVRGKRCKEGGQCTMNEVKGCLKERCEETTQSVGWQALTVQYSTQHSQNQLDMEAMGPWSDWSDCTSCYKLRTRECLTAVCNVMSLNDVGVCDVEHCDNTVSEGNERTIALSRRSNQDELSSFYQVFKRSEFVERYQWERNSRCSADCGFGVTVKQAVCESGDCSKVKFEVTLCLNTFCSGTTVQEMGLVTVTTADFGATMLGEWSSWGQCECTAEVQRRTRGCYAGYGCPANGVLSATRTCACSTGVWGDWSAWGECSKKCGRGGVRHQSRPCLLEPCLGEMSRSESCFVAPCTTSTLSAWSDWSVCTNNGGVFTRYKSRRCKQYNSQPCEGSLYNVEVCFPNESQTENTDIRELNDADSTALGAWVNQGECLVRTGGCGAGEQVKMRECFMAVPHACPEGSMTYDECTMENIGTCTDIFRFVECWISCGGSETNEEKPTVPEWSNIGECRVEHYTSICGKGHQAQVLSCYNSNSCSQEVFAECSGSDLFTCPALFRSVECETQCEDEWMPVPDDCWSEPCDHIEINVNFTEDVLAFKTKYSSRLDFYGAVEFWRGEEYVGLAAWSTKGAYLEGCGYEEAPFERAFNDTFLERVWTLAINRTHIWLLMDNVVMMDYYRFIEGATCRGRYQDAMIDSMIFRNLKAVRAEYQFIAKGALGEWEAVGPCTVPSAETCGAGVQIEAQTCYKDNSCPLRNFKSCSEDNFLKCSGQFRTRSCEVACEELSIGKRQEISLGELEIYGGCIAEEECGRGEMVLIYSCYFTNSCPPEYYRSHDCDDFFSCTLLFSVVPCTIPCEENHTELGEWEAHGECTVIGAGVRCGPEAGTLLQVRSCIESKTCPPSTVTAQCDDPWQCSDYFRSIECNIECTDEIQEVLDDSQITALGPWEDLYSCIVNTEEGCGFGTLPQVRGCYKTKSCPSWAASAMYCNGLMNCTELFRSVQCVVSCQDSKSERALGKWEDLGQCLPNDGVCGEGEQVKVRSCYKDYSCPLSSSPQHCATFFSCSSDVFKTETCNVYCEDSAPDDAPAELVIEAIGEWADYGECQPLQARECGEGELLQVRECQMRQDCPVQRNIKKEECLEDLISCSQYFRTKHCYKSCYSVELATIPPSEALDIIRPRSCQEVLNSNLALISGVYSLYVDDTQFDVWCEMMVDEERDQYTGWTLISSFVNDGQLSWGGNSQAVKDNWQGNSSFGSIDTSKESDFKSIAWSMVRGSELLVEDRFGTLQFNLNPRKLTMHALMTSQTQCSKAPLVGPRYNTRASNRVWRQHAIFAIYPALSEKEECAVLNPRDRVYVPVLAFGGQACSLMGAGMSTLKYAPEGMDWHMSLNPTTSCNTAGCDNTRCSGPWFEHTLATSSEKNFEAGSHDDSKWGRLFIK